MAKAERINLTTGRVNSFVCPPGKTQAFLWDVEVPGLAVRSTPTGVRAYIFQGYLNGTTPRITIGSTKVWMLDAARKEARRLQSLIDQGDDPRQDKAERIAQTEVKRRNAIRSKEPALVAWEAYLEARKVKWSARSLLDHQRLMAEGGKPKTRGKKKGEGNTTLPGMLRPLLQLPLSGIDRETVSDWLKNEVVSRPTQASNAFVRLRAFLNWCSDRKEYRGLVQLEACGARVARDELPKRAAKDDCLQREQLRLWFQHVIALPNKVQSAYLQSLLLTGARREELASLKWSDIDFVWKSLTIRDKVEGERTIPLTPYVATLLAALPRRTMENNGETIPNPWVFSSPTAESGRLQEPRIAHNKALVAGGLPPLTLHGLRRSFGTLAEWVECPAGVSAQIMGHKPSAIAEKHYRRRPLDLLRMWHIKIEEWILEQAGVEFMPEQTGLSLVKKSSA